MKGFSKRIFSNLTSGLKITEYLHPLVFMPGKCLKKNRYGNLFARFQGERFDSISECIRYKFLLRKEKLGEIKNLNRQVKFAVSDKTSYVADFVFQDKDNNIIVEDVKSPKLVNSPKFRANRRLMMNKYGIEIRIISPMRIYKWVI